MNKNKRLLLMLVAVGVVLAIAGLTAYILRSVDSSDQSSTGTNAPEPDQLTEEEKEAKTNEQAQQIESQAEELMSSEPQEAAKKYKEAAKLYEEAGNDSKSADMSDNAKTAESMTPPEKLKFGDPTITRQKSS